MVRAPGARAVRCRSGQLSAAGSGTQDSATAGDYAHRLAEELEKSLPHLVVSRMNKNLRRNRVLLDRSQNHAARTTICPCSPRGRERPTVVAPRTSDELSSPGSLRQLEFDEVLERVQDTGDAPALLLRSVAGTGPKVLTS